MCLKLFRDDDLAVHLRALRTWVWRQCTVEITFKGFRYLLMDYWSAIRPEIPNVPYPTSRKIVKGTCRMAECRAKMVQVDTERYSCQEATQVSLTARHRQVRAIGSQALVCPPMRAWVSAWVTSLDAPITLPTVKGGSSLSYLLGHWHEPNTHLS